MSVTSQQSLILKFYTYSFDSSVSQRLIRTSLIQPCFGYENKSKIVSTVKFNWLLTYVKKNNLLNQGDKKVPVPFLPDAVTVKNFSRYSETRARWEVLENVQERYFWAHYFLNLAVVVNSGESYGGVIRNVEIKDKFLIESDFKYKHDIKFEVVRLVPLVLGRVISFEREKDYCVLGVEIS